MRFERLYLKAFGAFQDRVIDLPRRGARDLHLVYGPNEAGKSTLLRAVTAFLFDIPERTGDAFLHDYNALRIGAALARQDGSRMSVMRRKARKAKLFAIDEATGAEVTDRPLAEDTLASLLQGLDLAHYRQLFALDTAGLEQGSAELLRGEGEVGRSLFQAAAGVASLRGVLDALDEEAIQIFKPRGSTSRLNRVLSELEEIKREMRGATVRTTAWETARQDSEAASKEHAGLRARQRELRSRLSQLQRISANLPLLADRHAKRAELEQIAHIPELAPECAQIRATAQEQLRQASEKQQAAASRLERLKTVLGGIVVRIGLIENAATVEQAFHGIAAYRDARDAVPRLQSELESLEEELHRLLRDIGAGVEIADAATLLPDETLTAAARDLADQHVRLDADQRQFQQQLDSAQVELDEATLALSQCPTPRAVDALKVAVAEHAGLAGLEDEARELDLGIAQDAVALERGIAAIWTGSPADWLALTPPLPKTIEDFEKAFADLREQEGVRADKASTLERDLASQQQDLAGLAATGEAITQTEVAAARASRDATWKEVRESRLDGAAPAAAGTEREQPAQELAARFEATLREADRLADLLRADTERATKVANSRSRIAAMQDALRELEIDRAQGAAARQALEKQWATLLEPYRLSGISPAALREWTLKHERLSDERNRLDAQRLKREQVSEKALRGRACIDGALGEYGLAISTAEESCKGLLLRAQAACNAAMDEETKRQLRADRVARAKLDRDRARRKLDRNCTQLQAWRDSWAKTALALHLPGDAMPAQVRARLDQLAKMSTAMTRRRETQAALTERRHTVNAFINLVAGLAMHTDESEQGQSPDALATKLYDSLTEARTQSQQQVSLSTDVDREKQALNEASLAANQAQETLQALMAAAGCTKEDELPAIEVDFRRKQALQKRLHEIDEQLVQSNACTVEEVLQQAGERTLDAVAQECFDCEAAIEDLDSKVEEAHGRLVEARQHLEAIGGTDAAAEAQQEVLSLSARAATEARQYARLKLAGTLLSRVIQTYREQHQGPMLQRASAVFARITLGSFSGLAVDYDEDQQVLVGLRPGGERVAVAGMSQGTRDQLFLSLRIAAIEQHLASRGAFPVIVDDLLVQFDDARAMAALEVLGEMSTHTQVLFFTHHEHLVELAAASELGRAIRVQRL